MREHVELDNELTKTELCFVIKKKFTAWILSHFLTLLETKMFPKFRTWDSLLQIETFSPVGIRQFCLHYVVESTHYIHI